MKSLLMVSFLLLSFEIKAQDAVEQMKHQSYQTSFDSLVKHFNSNKVLIIYNGFPFISLKVYTFKQSIPQQTKSVKFLEAKYSNALYGNMGNNGAIVINTKGFKLPTQEEMTLINGIPYCNPLPTKLKASTIKTKNILPKAICNLLFGNDSIENIISIKTTQKKYSVNSCIRSINFRLDDEQHSFKSLTDKYYKHINNIRPAFIVDGKYIKHNNIPATLSSTLYSFQASEIIDIKVLNKRKAILKYGLKARHGRCGYKN